MKNLLIVSAIAITSLSALAQSAPKPTADGELGYSAAAPRATAFAAGSRHSAVLGASAAPQAAQGLTRAQVRAELDAALRSGEAASGEFGAAGQR